MADDAMTPRGRTVLRILNQRERQLLVMVCAGHSNRVIAHRVELGEQVVKNYLRNVFKKAGVRTRQELVVFAWKHGVVTCPCQARRRFLSENELLAGETLSWPKDKSQNRWT